MVNDTFVNENVPCYIYREERIVAQCRRLKRALSSFEFLYSIKANPFEKVIQSVAKEGFGSDAASAYEVALSARNGIEPERIFYSAPGKTNDDIISCYGKCVIIADSFHDVARINAEALRRDQITKIGIRVNPDFTMDSDTGLSSKFGIDIEQIDALEALLRQCVNVRVAGIHIHVKSQILDFAILGRYYINCFRIAKKIGAMTNAQMEFINFGSGIGALYDAMTERPFELEKLSEMAANMVEENRASLHCKLYIETGRFVVCNAGTYYTEVVDIKVSHGRKYLVVQNGMNGFMRPAIASLLHKTADGKTLPGYEPLYTSERAFSVSALNCATRKERVTVVGNLCTALDVLAENIELNAAKIGDVIAVANAGSYAYTLSPLLFSSHPPPRQFFEYTDGRIE